MTIKNQYEKGYNELIATVCKDNQQLFKRFFQYQEYKLKRKNNLDRLDNGCYKTLKGYVDKLRNVDKWFKGKPWKDLTKQDIKRVYDALEDGKIKNQRGKPFVDRKSYYNKVFKSKPFNMAGKDELAREVMEFYKPKKDTDVIFFLEDDFKKMFSVVSKPVHKLLLWFMWDIGESINSTLHLKKKDWVRQVNPHTNEPEYAVNLPRDVIKRSRTTRTELTNHQSTVKFADMVLKDLKEDDLVFNFKYSQGKKILNRAVKLSGVKTIKGTKPTWKDFRSSMACYLLKQGWSTDEVNSRLGHVPSSPVIDKYISYLAIDRHTPKKKLYDSNLAKIQEELDKSKQREKLYVSRMKDLEAKMQWMETVLKAMENHEKVIVKNKK